jgi:hypothetical protein
MRVPRDGGFVDRPRKPPFDLLQVLPAVSILRFRQMGDLFPLCSRPGKLWDPGFLLEKDGTDGV